MPPVLAQRRAIQATTETSSPPSTWEVISVVSGAAWFTYTIYSSASQIWQWIQRKIEIHNEKLAMKERLIPLRTTEADNKRLQRRDQPPSKLQKRWEPFSGLVNSVYWLQRVVKWIYMQADNIPLRVQLGIDRNYTAIQDAEWRVKNEQAEELAKNFAAREFAEFYKKKHLDPYEVGSELYEENAALLREAQKQNSDLQRRVGSRPRDFKVLN